MVILPRKKLITPRRLQRGNIVYHTEADPNFAEISFLMSCEETAPGSELITPTVGPTMDWSLVSGTQPTQVDGEISAVRSKYGDQSIYFKESAGAANAGWNSTAKQAGAVYGFAGDFTVETDIWIVDNASVIDIFGLWDFGERQWLWSLEAGNSRMDFRISLTGSNNDTPIAQHAWGGGSAGVPTDAWHHIAVCRQGTNWFAWLDGVQSDTGTIVNSNVIHIPTDAYFVIGQSGFQDGTGQVEVYLDNLRITDGTARYTSAFTPPTEAHPSF